MATSSTDAFSTQQQLGSKIQLYSNYSLVSVTTGGAFWPGEDSASPPASDNNTWEVDEEETIKRRIYELKRQFHNGRYLLVRHLPRDATEQEVRELLSGYLVHSVQLQPSSGSARVLLAEPEVLETWSRSQHTLRGHKVTISPSNTEGLLCVARLPHDFTEEDFGSLAASLGQITYCFLMRSEKTGESKGYGFIEYTTKELALQAKAVLDGREVRDCVLVCDWLDPSHVTFASLHSTCLYVDHLPRNYRDMGEFRRIFSKVINPPYCQIAMKNGALQDWGLVEFLEAEDAEETVACLNNYKIRGHSIRVQYCVPGVRAINIYMKILNDPGGKKRSALLPEPPANKVFSQLQNLTKHNPAFATSLQNIILTQIQNLSGGRPDGGLPPSQGPPPRGARPPPTARPPPPPPPPSSTSPAPATAGLNSNAQAALVILLAAQMQMQQQQQQQQQEAQQQQQQTTNNLLASPRVLNLLQTLVQQGDPQQAPHPAPAPLPPSQPQQPPPQDPRNSYPTSKPPHNHSNNNNVNKGVYRNGYKNGVSKSKMPLLPTPAPGGSYSGSSWEEGGSGGEGESGLAPLLSGLLTGLPGLSGQKAIKEDLQGTISTLLSNAHSLQQLLGSLTNEHQALPPPPPVSLGHPPMTVSLPPPPVATSAPPPMYHANPLMSMLLSAATGPPKPSLLGDGPFPHDHFLPTHMPPPTLDQPPHLAPPPLEQPPPPPISSAPAFLFASPLTSRVGPTWSPPPIAPPPPALLHPASLPHPMASLPHPRFISPVYLTPTKHMGPPPHPMGPQAGFITPVGQKRKSNHILPSPEPSPENGYVGQHSQGIGGHYADSYLVKKLKKH